MTTALLEDLVARGIRPDRRRLFVVDGAKALRSAIAQVFGVSLIRFGGHLSKGEYDGHHGRQQGAADAAELHGRLQDRRGAPGPR